VGPNIWENRQRGPREIRPLRPAADLVSAGERPILARDLAGTVAYAGVDLNLEEKAAPFRMRCFARSRTAAAVAGGTSTMPAGS
jgi:hypothetical protein